MKVLKLLLFFGLLIILFLAVFFALRLVAYRDGKKCYCYGIKINNICLGIKSTCTGLLEPPDLLKQDSINCNNKENEETLTINFSECKNCRENVYVGFGSTTYEMYKSGDENYCIMRFGGEIENPNWKGDLNTTCTVPKNIGTKTFKINNYGVDFSSLAVYCK